MKHSYLLFSPFGQPWVFLVDRPENIMGFNSEIYFHRWLYRAAKLWCGKKQNDEFSDRHLLSGARGSARLLFNRWLPMAGTDMADLPG